MILRRYFGWPDWRFGNTFDEFDRMRRQLDLLSGSLMGRTAQRSVGVFPLLNLTEDKDHYYIRAELPGVKATDLEIQATGNTVSIAGERKIQEEDSKAKYHRREREAGKFSRVISLDREINAEKVAAGLSNGILKVVLPKSEKAKPKQITVK
ncbi:MAG: Hsp20/alpha crystallin family protein [Thermodesulfobacteriota bacterium]